MSAWAEKHSKVLGTIYERADGVTVYRPSGRSRFRAHRPNEIGYGYEDLAGAAGTALIFQTADAAQDAADREWPLSVSEGVE